MSGRIEVQEWVQNNWTFECGEDVNEVFEQIDEDWNNERRERFSLVDVLRDELPDFMVWLQERIDDECEDDTETITFEPTRAQEDETREDEILETEIELLEAKRDLLQLQIDELERPERGIIERVTSFIRNIFGG